MIMLRTTLLALALPIAGITAAQLAPDAPATTRQHLFEVNARWTSMHPSVLLDETPIAGYRSEADRIADHLLRVHAQLSTNLPETMGQDTRSRRTALLDTLHAYAVRGVFPMNNDVMGRSPVFIDAQGNVCAVGHLMIASGNAPLAERIRTEMNLAYVHDIHLPEAVAWAVTNGFTMDELAWIQPTYGHMKRRNPHLLASVLMPNGDLFEVRIPAEAQRGQTLDLVLKTAKGDKLATSFPALSGVHAVEFAGRVFVGGLPTTTGPAAEVYEWNGKSLVAHDPFTGRVGIGALYVTDGKLHVRGYEPDQATYQEYYLSAAGEWKPAPTWAEPIRVEPE